MFGGVSWSFGECPGVLGSVLVFGGVSWSFGECPVLLVSVLEY